MRSMCTHTRWWCRQKIRVCESMLPYTGANSLSLFVERVRLIQWLMLILSLKQHSRYVVQNQWSGWSPPQPKLSKWYKDISSLWVSNLCHIWLTGMPAVRQLRFYMEAGHFPTVETAGLTKRSRWGMEIRAGRGQRGCDYLTTVSVLSSSLWARTVRGVSCMNKPPLRARP